MGSGRRALRQSPRRASERPGPALPRDIDRGSPKERSVVAHQGAGRGNRMTISACDGVYFFYTDENLSPRITAQFLERQRRLLLPAQFAREHQNQWVDQADAFVRQADVDGCMGTGWMEQPLGMGLPAVITVDIGTVHDPTVLAVGWR